MVAPSQVDGVRRLAEPAVRSAGLVLEDLTISPAGRRRVLRITVDLPEDRLGGVPMDAVATASQALSAALDASDVMGGAPYVLEVSSPGVDRPLTDRRHWARARGRLVAVEPAVAGGPVVTGRLVTVDDAGLGLDDGRRLPWEQVRRGRVQVEFAPSGDDASGDDASDDDVLDDDVLDDDVLDDEEQ